MEEFKWPAIACVGLFVAGAIRAGLVAFAENATAQAAMEHGYIQQVDEESAQVIWVKIE